VVLYISYVFIRIHTHTHIRICRTCISTYLYIYN
jgi:hypothetical protein